MGASGRIGSMLRRHWPRDWPVRWFARRPGMDALGRILPGDPLADTAAFERDIAECRAVICVAAPAPGGRLDTSTPQAEAEGFARHTTLATALARSARAAGRPLLLASSAAIYGRPASDAPLREDDPLPPPDRLGAYGRAKHAMESAIAAMDAPVCVLRIGNVAGADAALGNWRPGYELQRLASGATPERSYIGPVSLAYAIAALAKIACDGAGDGTGAGQALPPCLNVAAPGTVAMGALLDAAGLPYAPVPPTQNTIACVTLDVSRLMALVPLAPAHAQSLVAEWRATTEGPGTPPAP
ncbi:MAG: NAD-dependent epimerase/dehydratase family protein [Shimia sp.]